MTWSMVYSGTTVATGLTLDKVEEVSAFVAEMFEQRAFGWLNLDAEWGDGIGFSRLFLSPGVGLSFLQENPTAKPVV